MGTFLFQYLVYLLLVALIGSKNANRKKVRDSKINYLFKEKKRDHLCNQPFQDLDGYCIRLCSMFLNSVTQFHSYIIIILNIKFYF